MLRRIGFLAALSLALLALVLAACTATPPELAVNPTSLAAGQTIPVSAAPAWPSYSWRLPKTLLTVAATYTLTGCNTTATGLVQPITKVDVVFKANAVPDTYLGPELPDGWITRQANDLSSFWSSTSITVETDPTSRILTHLVSAPVNQATTIIGNTITGLTKIAAAALGVPSAAGAAAAIGPQPCLNAKAISDRIATNKASLTDLVGQTSKEAVARQAALTKSINDDTNAITISISCDIDPGITPDSMEPGGDCPKTPDMVAGKDPSHPVQPDGRIAVIRLTSQDIAKTKWIVGFNPADPRTDLTDQQVGIFLDFDHAYPPTVALCPGAAPSCSRHRVYAGKDTMFREVAYINVSSSIVKVSGNTVVKDTSKAQPSKPVLLPFAQFGIPRKVAVIASFAQSPNWDLTLNTFGEMGTSRAGWVATGIGLSSLFGTAAGGASAVATEIRNSEAAVDPTLQGQVANAQALYNLANARQQLLQLCAKTYMPGVCP